MTPIPTEAPATANRYSLHNSVSATQMATGSRDVIELYYGPTSDFALTQLLYRDLFQMPNNVPDTPEGTIEEAGDGLDNFQYRLIFFGLPASEAWTNSDNRACRLSTSPLFFPQTLAKSLLDRYLATFYNLAPFLPKQRYQAQLDRMFSADVVQDTSGKARQIILVAIALAALSTDHWQWAEALFRTVRQENQEGQEVVNLESVQLDLLMISYQSPDSCLA